MDNLTKLFEIILNRGNTDASNIPQASQVKSWMRLIHAGSFQIMIPHFLVIKRWIHARYYPA
jgi:hypothetical protein